MPCESIRGTASSRQLPSPVVQALKTLTALARAAAIGALLSTAVALSSLVVAAQAPALLQPQAIAARLAGVAVPWTAAAAAGVAGALALALKVLAALRNQLIYVPYNHATR